MQMVFQDPYSSFDPQATVVNSVVEPLQAQRALSGRSASSAPSELFESRRARRASTSTATRASSPAASSSASRSPARSRLNPKLVVLRRAGERARRVDPGAGDQPARATSRTSSALAFLFIAHDLAVVRHVSDRIAVMYLGRIVEEGPADAVYTRPTHPYTDALLSAIPVPNPRVQRRARSASCSRGDIPSPANPPVGLPLPHPVPAT